MQARDIKKIIVSNTIREDQEIVALQWAKTFYHNPGNDTATEMTRLLAACVARGDFAVRTDADDKFTAPSTALNIADYLSHASRIIIDFKQLSDVNREALLHYFPRGIDNKIIQRPATHAVHRNPMTDSIVEDKGFLIGAAGLTNLCLGYDINDYGIDIAMGGAGQDNFAGNRIAADGASGHLYFHLNENDSSMLIGLEQTSPKGGHDQFDQGHSMLGASDTFTAACSLYFDHPIYQAKLLIEKQALPPRKYGGMRVMLTDDNWANVVDFLKDLKKIDGIQDAQRLLAQPPANSVAREPVQFTKIDYQRYCNDAFKYLVPNDQNRQAITEWQLNLILLLAKSKNQESINAELSNALEAHISQLPELFKDKEHAYIKAMRQLGAIYQKEMQLRLDKNYAEMAAQHLASENDRLQTECREMIRTLNNVSQSMLNHANLALSVDRIVNSLQQMTIELEAARDQRVSIEDSFVVMNEKPFVVTQETVARLAFLLDQARTNLELLSQYVQPIPAINREQAASSRREVEEKLYDLNKTLQDLVNSAHNEIKVKNRELTALGEALMLANQKVIELENSNKNLNAQLKHEKNFSTEGFATRDATIQALTASRDEAIAQHNALQDARLQQEAEIEALKNALAAKDKEQQDAQALIAKQDIATNKAEARIIELEGELQAMQSKAKADQSAQQDATKQAQETQEMRFAAINKIMGAIDQLSELSLPSNGRNEAGDEAKALVDALNKACREFVFSTKSDQKAYEEFEKKCNHALAQPKKLYHHRAASLILKNIAIGVVTLGIALLGNRIANGSWLLFNNVTNAKTAIIEGLRGVAPRVGG